MKWPHFVQVQFPTIMQVEEVLVFIVIIRYKAMSTADLVGDIINLEEDIAYIGVGTISEQPEYVTLS